MWCTLESLCQVREAKVYCGAFFESCDFVAANGEDYMLHLDATGGTTCI